MHKRQVHPAIVAEECATRPRSPADDTRKNRHRCFALATLLFVAAPVPAQTPPPVGGFGETVDVRVINLEVVVTDKQGLPVTGLGPGDFKLQVDGKQVPIQYFTEVREATRSKDPSEDRTFRVPSSPRGLRSERASWSSSTTTSLERDRNHVLDKLTQDLALLRPEDRMAVVAYDGRGSRCCRAGRIGARARAGDAARLAASGLRAAADRRRARATSTIAD
ncbi:MAG: hypothetical protein R2862_05410 [Thermoanaerobaculia bacterium]